jgi:hypothetical protein
MSTEDLQNDLFEFGFDPGPADGIMGPRTTTAMAAFGAVARQHLRIDHNEVLRVQPQRDFDLRKELDRWRIMGWTWAPRYAQQRVRVSRYDSLLPRDPRLVRVSSVVWKRCRLHHVAAASFERMVCEAGRNGVNLRAASGHRPRRWVSRVHYETEMRRRYGSVARGQRFMAYSSPHETGLAVDFGSGGLSPNSKTIKKQRATGAHKWLEDNAHKFGWRPYLAEPWHWEHPVSDRQFVSLTEVTK